MYGPETKDEHKAQIEKSLDGKIELKLEVIFYKKNGKPKNLIKFRWIYFDINYEADRQGGRLGECGRQKGAMISVLDLSSQLPPSSITFRRCVCLVAQS